MVRRSRTKRDKNGRDISGRQEKVDYEDIERTNKDFELYYKQQKFIPEDEWDTFMTTIRRNLPAAFRLNHSGFNQTIALRNVVNNQRFEESNESLISCLKWYPNKCAFQMNFSRVEIRKNEKLQKLHNFLISESESGYISRQEAVSMIPPLVLDVKPGHRVLDVCAAPGSKTAQIIEMLHTSNDKEKLSNPGVVVANDVDNKRCYMLVHQSKRLDSPAFVITNHDAGTIPNFCCEADGKNVKLKFDRILCDVPCSGDGTIRKNYDVWTKWSVANGNNFHGIQSRIAKRSLQLLAKDGIMVYSTCSMNPMEDEAVISYLLNQSEGGLELLDVSDKLQGLKYIEGLENWCVMTRDNKVVNSIDEVEEKFKTQIREPLFPPENIKELNIKRCIRILPHHQDTGGFFVAALRKTVEQLPWESKADEEVRKDPPTKKARVFKEDPFLFLNGDEEEWLQIKSFFKISDDFPAKQLMYRSENGKKRNIYFLTEAAKTIVTQNPKIRFINGGVRLFSRIDDKVCSCSYRITQDGLSTIYPYLNSKFIVEINEKELEMILRNESILNENLRTETQEKLTELESGPVILVHRSFVVDDNKKEEIIIPFCGWKGKTTLRAYILKNDRIHFLRICGFDTDALEEEQRKKFSERQERKKERLRQVDEMKQEECQASD